MGQVEPSAPAGGGWHLIHAQAGAHDWHAGGPRQRALTPPLAVALAPPLLLALQSARVPPPRPEAAIILQSRRPAGGGGRVFHSFEAGGAHAQLGGFVVGRARAVVLGHDAVPELGVILRGASFERGHIERVQQVGAGGGGGAQAGGVNDFGARENRVDVFVHQRARGRAARRVILLEYFFSTEAQDGGHLVPRKLFGGGRIRGSQGGGRGRRRERRAVAAHALPHRVLARRVHALDDQVIQHHLLLGPLQDVFLHGPRGEEAVDVDRLRLADAVRARHGLEIVLRVPVRVEDDDGVGGGQVDA